MYIYTYTCTFMCKSQVAIQCTDYYIYTYTHAYIRKSQVATEGTVLNVRSLLKVFCSMTIVLEFYDNRPDFFPEKFSIQADRERARERELK